MSTPAERAYQAAVANALRQGYVPTTYGPRIDVTEHGAIGDGVHDDTSAIQAAIDAWPAPGGPVYLPPGTYKITSALTFQTSTRLCGAGVGLVTQTRIGDEPVTRIDASSITNASVINIPANSQCPEVADLELYGPAAADCGSGSLGILVGQSTTRLVLRNLVINGFYCGAYLFYTAGANLYNVRPGGQANCGLNLYGAAYITESGGYYGNAMGYGANPANIRIEGSSYSTFSGTLIDEGFGASTSSIVVLDSTEIDFIHCRVLTATWGIRLGNGVLDPTNCRLIDCTVAPFDPDGWGSVACDGVIDIYGSGHMLMNVDAMTPTSGGPCITDSGTDTVYLSVVERTWTGTTAVVSDRQFKFPDGAVATYSDDVIGAFQDSYEETTYNDDGNPTLIARWTDVGKGTQIYQTEITYTGNDATTVVQKRYVAGVLTNTQTTTKTYDEYGKELTSTSVVS